MRAVAVIASLLAAVLGLIGSAPAAHAQADPIRLTFPEYFPTVPGMEYVYRERDADGSDFTGRVVAGTPTALPGLSGFFYPFRGHPIDGSISPPFVLADGLTYFSSESQHGFRVSLSDDMDPDCIFRASQAFQIPNGLTRGQRFGQRITIRGLDRNPDDDVECGTTDNHEQGTFVGLVDVTVPAGTFKECAQVVIEETSIDDEGEVDGGTVILYFARGVGIVKEVDPDPEDGGVVELISFSGAGPKIAGYKFDDRNGNGAWDRDREPGIAGWQITLSGPDTLTTTTDAGGRFEFAVTRPGTYTVTEESRPGWQATMPAKVQREVRLRAGETIPEVLFGNRKLPTRLVGYKFADRNGNGLWERDREPAIRGWRFTMTGPEAGTTTTDAGGRFEFVVTTPGVYALTEESRAGWRPTTATTARREVRLEPGEVIHPALFGNQPTPVGGPPAPRPASAAIAIAHGPAPTPPASHSVWILYADHSARLVQMLLDRLGAPPRQVTVSGTVQIELPTGEPIDLAPVVGPAGVPADSLWILSNESRVYRGSFTLTPGQTTPVRITGCVRALPNPAGAVAVNLASGPGAEVLWAVTPRLGWRLFSAAPDATATCGEGTTIAQAPDPATGTVQVVAADRAAAAAVYWVLMRDASGRRVVSRVLSRDANQPATTTSPCEGAGCALPGAIANPIGIAGTQDTQSYWLLQSDSRLVLTRTDGTVLTSFPAPQ